MVCDKTQVCFLIGEFITFNGVFRAAPGKAHFCCKYTLSHFGRPIFDIVIIICPASQIGSSPCQPGEMLLVRSFGITLLTYMIVGTAYYVGPLTFPAEGSGFRMRPFFSEYFLCAIFSNEKYLYYLMELHNLFVLFASYI